MARQTFRRLDPTAEGRAAGDGSVTVEIDGGSISVAELTWDLFTAIADPTGAWVGTAGDGGALIIAAVEGEEPFVVGTCMAESYTPFLRSALEAVGARGADDGIALLDEAVAQGASSKLVTWFATRAGLEAEVESSTPWADRDPRTRTINPTEAPVEVRDRLARFPFVVERPARWSRAEATTICPFLVGTGWGDCSALSGASEEALAGISVEAIPGAAVELWILDGSATFASPIQHLTTLDADLIDQLASAAGALALVVRLDGDSPAEATAVVSTRPIR